MAEQAKIMTLHDHDTGEAIAPRTDVKALSGKGKKWNYVGFTDDDTVGLIEGTWPCNRNLLDNWYFVGGGSQQGGGKFPINQRTILEHTNLQSSQYTIDRWVWHARAGRIEEHGVKIEKDYITIYGLDWGQYIENDRLPIGTYTFSVLTLDGTLVSKSYTFSSEVSVNATVSNDDIGLGVSLFWRWNGGGRNISLFDIYTTKPVNIVAAKLELGSQQTLAHKEGDTWVLNEIPDYATELLKCQRYLQPIYYAPEDISIYGGIGGPLTDGKYGVYIDLRTAVPMRSRPTIISNLVGSNPWGRAWVAGPGGASGKTAPIDAFYISAFDGVNISFYGTTSTDISSYIQYGFGAAQIDAWPDTGGGLFFSAEL